MLEKPFLTNYPQMTDIGSSKYRFVILFLSCFSMFVNGCIWLTFAPMIDQLKELYHLSQNEATFGAVSLANVIMIPGIILFNIIMTKINLRQAAILYSFLTLLGFAFRILVKEGFFWIVLGQLFGAFGAPFAASIPSKISNIWFPAKERPLATNIMFGFVGLSFAAGLYFPSLYVDFEHTNEKTLDQIQEMLIMEAWIALVMFISVVIFYRKEPEIPPSTSAVCQKLSLKESVKSTTSTKNRIFLLAAVAFLSSSGLSLQTIFQPLVGLYSVSATDSANIITIATVLGCILGVPMAMAAGKYYKYKSFILIYSIIQVIFLAYLIAVRESSSRAAYYLGGIGYVSLFIGYQPLLFELQVEICFPAMEEVLVSAATIALLIVSDVQIYVVNLDLEKKNGSRAFLNLMIVSLIGVVCILLVKEDLKRKQYEEETKNLSDVELKIAYKEQINENQTSDYTVDE